MRVLSAMFGHNFNLVGLAGAGVAKKIVRLSAALAVTSLTAGCAYFSNIVEVESENKNSRISIVVIHHTAINFARSLEVLTKASPYSVSSHYLVPEPNDASYPKSKLKTYQLVDEQERAWHAGRSYWRGRTGLNDQSIGIEIVNVPECYELETVEKLPEGEPAEQACFYPDFPGQQMELVEELLKDILERNPHISPLNIVAHSDIAPSRKSDPGPRFPWQRLANIGIGAWYDNETVVKYLNILNTREFTIEQLQTALNTYGYGIEITGEMDEQTKMVVRAFQLHFDRSNVSGEFTPDTVARLFALIEKYMSNQLPKFGL